jgi:hypothetical protein
MTVRLRSPQRPGRWFARITGRCLALAGAALLAGCASGDFGRVKSSFVTDDMHAWVGTETAQLRGGPISRYPLTDDERALRDLAYPLIEPPYDRNRWFSVLAEYGVARFFHHDWWAYDRRAYSVRLMDMDDKRGRSLAVVSGLTEAERTDALARIAENRCVIQWVERSLLEREASYRYALEHLVIADPSNSAAEADRVITELQGRTAQNRILPPLQVAPRVAVARVVESDR